MTEHAPHILRTDDFGRQVEKTAPRVGLIRNGEWGPNFLEEISPPLKKSVHLVLPAHEDTWRLALSVLTKTVAAPQG